MREDNPGSSTQDELEDAMSLELISSDMSCPVCGDVHSSETEKCRKMSESLDAANSRALRGDQKHRKHRRRSFAQRLSDGFAMMEE